MIALISFDLHLFSKLSEMCMQVYKTRCVQDGKTWMECCHQQSSRSWRCSTHCKYLLWDSFQIFNPKDMGSKFVCLFEQSDCFYTAGWTEDLHEVVHYLHRKQPESPLFAVGISLGANLLVKYFRLFFHHHHHRPPPSYYQFCYCCKHV